MMALIACAHDQVPPTFFSTCTNNRNVANQNQSIAATTVDQRAQLAELALVLHEPWNHTPSSGCEFIVKRERSVHQLFAAA